MTADAMVKEAKALARIHKNIVVRTSRHTETDMSKLSKNKSKLTPTF